MQRIIIILLIGIVLSCNSKKEKTQIKENNAKASERLSGIEIVSELENLGYFNLTETSELENAKKEMAEASDVLEYFSGTTRGETLDFVDNRFFFIDCEELFETDGLTHYLNKVKVTFEKLKLQLEISNEQSEQTDDYWKHTIDLNNKQYIAFEDEFTIYDWDIAYINFIEMLNNQLEIQNNENRFYPIRTGNDGEIVLLTDKQFQFIKKHFPNDDEHPKTMANWKENN
ncbi:hypothetical protein OAB20_06235 [Winogradskyella sp.]|nr:hypothetical protein [Winogradskyella sp.]MDC0007039.1 hypothetical protein [Winogradskyella sp.]MDC1506035.1 hypothetical protein [Winogradskyella sp.]